VVSHILSDGCDLRRYARIDCRTRAGQVASFSDLKPVICSAQFRPVIVSTLLLSLVGALRAWLQWVGPLPGDWYAVAHFVSPGPDHEVLRRATAFYSGLGNPLTALALVCVGLLVLWFGADRRTAYGLVVACLVIPLNALLKLVSGPTPLWSAAHVHDVGHNFPSGHVAFVTSVVGYLGLVAARRDKRVAVAMVLLVVLGMGPARVLAGAHLVSDVIAGYLVGLSVLVMAIAAADCERSEVSLGG
jgi:membrane-associated phospholipid phosphatase